MADAVDRDRPLRVLHLNDQTGWGGGELQTWLLARGLAELGVENRALVAAGGELERRLRALLPADRLRRLPRALWPAAALAVRQLAADCDVVHAHTGRAVPALAWAGGRLRVAHRRMSRLPSRWGLRRLGRVDLVICIAEAVRRGLAEAGLGAGGRPALVTVPSAVAPPHPPPRAVALEGCPVLGYLGHFNRIKGLDLLLEALPEVLRRHPGLVLHLVGEGAEEGRLRRQAEALGVASALRVHAWQRQPEAWLAGLGLYVQPSREEGLGTAALQAQALGVPVLATRAGGLPEAVRHGVTGWLVEAGSAAALRDGLLQALADEGRLRAWGEAGPARVEAEFSPAAMARRTLAAYRSLLP